MIVTGLVLAALAALLHCFIFYLETVAWESERARKVFGTTVDEARATKSMASNQGFYNLLLAVITVVGIGVWFRDEAIGQALVLAGTGSMLAAALFLGLTSPSHRGAAVRQGLLPLLAVAFIIVGIVA